MSRPSFDLKMPVVRTTSVVFASPHSGRDYSQRFLGQSVLDAHAIRSSEDAFVDQIYASALENGAPLLLAQAPRAYVDLNRAPDELDPALIEGLLRGRHNPRINSGLGVIPRVVASGKAIYSGKLTRSEAESRLEEVWHPYHACLDGLLRETLARFGEAILIDCHSMPHEAIATLMRRGEDLPEVVLGDRFGDSASDRVVSAVESAFQRAGFRVCRNMPFAGAYVSQHYGRPRRGQHVVQVEIDRALYMDEKAIRPHPDFPDFLARIGRVVAEIAALGRPAVQQVAAE